MSKQANPVSVFPPVDRERTDRSQGNRRPILQPLIGFVVVLAGLAGATTAWASDEIDIKRANWNNDKNKLIVRGEHAPDNATVTVRYGEKDDNGAVIGTTEADGDGDWEFRITNLNPVPCDVTAQAGGDDDDKEVRRAPRNCSDDGGVQPPPDNKAPTANAGPDRTVTLASGQTTIAVTLDGSASSDSDGTVASYNWTGSPNPADVVGPTVNLTEGSHTFTLVVTDNQGAESAADTVAITVKPATSGNVPPTACNPADLNLSINSTSQGGCPGETIPQQAQVPNNNYSVLAINDLGMHCGDLDTRISSILPPFQVLLAQVVQKGTTPTLNPTGVDVFYSAAANPNDPIQGSEVFDGVMANGDTYKTNFWDFPVPEGTYDAFYPAFDPFNPSQTLTPLAGPPFNVSADVGLPVPNVEHLYIGPDGIIGNGDESLTAVLHAMPGIYDPYTANDPKWAQEHYVDKPFFINFPFGYVAEAVNWYEGAGVPFAAFDDNGRENAYPLVRVQAKNAAGATLSTVDTVLPISGEANCGNCHAEPDDLLAVTGNPSRSSAPTTALTDAGLTVALSLDDPDENLPPRVSLEYAADINTLRLHDLKHGKNYVSTACDNVPAGENCLNTAPAPCDINANGGNGNATCLTNQALVQEKPVVCQVCHYTPALDLAQLGPLTGPEGSIANGRNQLSHKSNSNVMHSHHGGLDNGNLFPPMPAPIQDLETGEISNQGERLAVLEETCYQCHPGTNVQCLRGAMFNGGMLCNDCHGGMEQVGTDFSQNVSPTNPAPASLLLGGGFYDPENPQPRVPWANEPGCGSCHTGDVRNNQADMANTIANTRDIDGNLDGIRLRQAYVTGDAKATPIVPTNKRFAEPEVPEEFNGTPNKGAGNPQLYRVSTGHGGVMCEGCHGATHAEWPNGNPNANDNVAANQLQGHTGPIVECDTCHTNVNDLSQDATPSSLRGPHGMHAVGANTDFATGKHKEKLEEGQNKNACIDCHGKDGQGSVLSRMAEDRVLECKEDTAFCPDGKTALFPKGHAVGCVECHKNGLFED